MKIIKNNCIIDLPGTFSGSRCLSPEAMSYPSLLKSLLIVAPFSLPIVARGPCCKRGFSIVNLSGEAEEWGTASKSMAHLT